MSIKINKIRRYVAQHGFGSVTPHLSSRLSFDTFRKHYYHKRTLLEFCRTHNIPTYGLKNDLNRRIEAFLKTGKVANECQSKRASDSTRDSYLELTLDRQVVNYKSDSITREFFAKNLPDFSSFSAYVQKWLKQRLANGDIFTYADVIEEHKHFLQRRIEAKSAGASKQVVHDSCQFNQFLIDYNRNVNQKPHSAKEAWLLVQRFCWRKNLCSL